MKKAGVMRNFPTENYIKNRYAIAIIGPTAVGKTTLSFEIANRLPVEIVSADSRQIFRYLDIGTAKPTKEERNRVPHHFVDICYPDEYFSSGQFGKEGEVVVNNIFKKEKIPLIVGGSGLYVQALCEGFFEEEYSIEEKKESLKIRQELSFLSKDVLYSKLMEVDPETAKLYSDKNYVRLIRALEFYTLKRIPISLYRKLYHRKPNFKTIYIGLICKRDRLYSIIEQRVVQMWKKGLPNEVRHIIDLGYSPNLNSLNTVGYKETIEYLHNKLSESEAIELIQKNTRNYAKRQITWFKRNQNINWFDIENENFVKNILNFLENKVLIN